MSSTPVSGARFAASISMVGESRDRAPDVEEAESCVQEYQDALQLRTAGDR